MGSKWGEKNNLPGYDKFRTGLTYQDVLEMVKVSEKHKQRRRGSVLGLHHEIKLQLYYQAVDAGYGEEEK